MYLGLVKEWRTTTPELSPQITNEWIGWCMQQVNMPVCLQELQDIPCHSNLWEFARRVRALFQQPKASCHAAGMKNDYSALLAPQSLDSDCFLPIQDMYFRGQDFWLKQPQKTLAYAKALQHWVEKAQSSIPGDPHQLLESMLDLWQEMEPLVTFMDEEVLEDLQPSNWVLDCTIQVSRAHPREHSHGRTSRAGARGMFLPVYVKGWLKAQTTTQTVSKPAATAQVVLLKQEDTAHQWPPPLPGFAEIVQSLWGDNPPQVVMGIPPELAKDQGPIQMVGSTLLSAQLFQETTSCTMCIDMVTCLMNLVGVGIIHPADDHLIPTLKDVDSGCVANHPPSAIIHQWLITLFGCAWLFLFGMFALMCFISFILLLYYD